MTQQVFADYIGLAPATLSSIFNDRTRPTLNVVESIKKKIPNISIEWLMFGEGNMYSDETPSREQASLEAQTPQQSMLDFDAPGYPSSQGVGMAPPPYYNVRATPPEAIREEVKIVDKPQRRVLEIRVFYDDQTWETFVPAKK